MNVERGDLALVLKSDCGNAFKIVDVLDWYERGHYHYDDGNGWNHASGWLCEGRDLFAIDSAGRITKENFAVFPDAWLMRINPKAGAESRELEMSH